jgi:hypothetical protein
MVPMASCDEAATHLINALGGAEVCKKVVGGTKWWQVRAVLMYRNKTLNSLQVRGAKGSEYSIQELGGIV